MQALVLAVILNSTRAPGNLPTISFRAITVLLRFRFSALSVADDLAGSAVKLIREQFIDYQAGDWDARINKYSEDSRIYYNTADRPITATEEAAARERSIAALSSYEFCDVETRLKGVVETDGRLLVQFNAVWQASFR